MFNHSMPHDAGTARQAPASPRMMVRRTASPYARRRYTRSWPSPAATAVSPVAPACITEEGDTEFAVYLGTATLSPSMKRVCPMAVPTALIFWLARKLGIRCKFKLTRQDEKRRRRLLCQTLVHDQIQRSRRQTIASSHIFWSIPMINCQSILRWVGTLESHSRTACKAVYGICAAIPSPSPVTTRYAAHSTVGVAKSTVVSSPAPIQHMDPPKIMYGT